MRRKSVAVVVMFAVVGLCVASALSYRSGRSGGTGDLPIYVGPSTICLSAPCTCVTIHATVPAADVIEAAVKVNETVVTIVDTFADNRGNLVVKLAFADVVAALGAPPSPSATISLTVALAGGDLSGVATVRVTE